MPAGPGRSGPALAVSRFPSLMLVFLPWGPLWPPSLLPAVSLQALVGAFVGSLPWIPSPASFLVCPLAVLPVPGSALRHAAFVTWACVCPDPAVSRGGPLVCLQSGLGGLSPAVCPERAGGCFGCRIAARRFLSPGSSFPGSCKLPRGFRAGSPFL